MKHLPMLLTADPLLPVRVLAAIAFIAATSAFIYMLRHLKRIERLIKADALLPAQRGPRNNMALIICAVPVVVMTLLLFLVLQA